MKEEIMNSPFCESHWKRLEQLEELMQAVYDGIIKETKVTTLWKAELEAWEAKLERYGTI